MIQRLTFSDFAKIKKAEFKFQDLNIFLGQQATGKSLTLQLINLLIDYRHIALSLKKYNYDWKTDPSMFPEIYFGEGMHGMLDQSIITQSPKDYELRKMIDFNSAWDKKTSQKCFYIPAQRFLVIEDDWPKAFNSFENKYPYVVREFSDNLRSIISGVDGDTIFPYKPKLKGFIKKRIEEVIYHDAQIKQVNTRGKKRVMLQVGNDKRNLPMTLISTGQREFLPYLISLYHLLPAGKVLRNGSIENIIIEEPEMGLHPEAIQLVMLTMIELLSRGYRVFVSTHSLDFMNYIWGLQEIITSKSTPKKQEALREMLQLGKNDPSIEYLNTILSKKITVNLFKPENGHVSIEDISTMSLSGDEINGTTQWGGLLSSSDLVNRVVSGL